MKILVFLLALCASVIALLYFVVQQPLLFISWESKTIDDQEVYNRIKFIPGWNTDTWIMQQSHQGLELPPHNWDRLAIVVDKSKSPHQAHFYQFEAGELKLGTHAEQSAYRAPCASCHVSGPRAIRPLEISGLQWLKTTILNFRIKTYVQVESLAGQPEQAHAPFRRVASALKTKLALKSCSACHGENTIRNALTLDHMTTVQFLIKNKQMPPWPLSLALEDEEYLKKWGF